MDNRDEQIFLISLISIVSLLLVERIEVAFSLLSVDEERDEGDDGRHSIHCYLFLLWICSIRCLVVVFRLFVSLNLLRC